MVPPVAFIISPPPEPNPCPIVEDLYPSINFPKLLPLEDLNGDPYEGTANTSNSLEWGITNLDESVSYRYIKIKPSNDWAGSWVGISEIEVWNDVVFQGPEFSTYIYLATLAFTFAVGYRRIPELMKEKN